MIAHTQGRITFKADGDANHYTLLDEGGRWLMSVLMNGEQLTAKQEANLRRIAVCWNACKGVSTEDLEMDNAAFIRVFNERNQLRADIETAEQDSRQKQARINRLEFERESMILALKLAAEINPFGSIENALARTAAAAALAEVMDTQTPSNNTKKEPA